MKKILVLSMAVLSLVPAVSASDPNFTASSLQGLDETSGYYYTAANGGAASPPNGINYLNVENRYGDYKCWGAARFDLTTIRNALNAALGAGNWRVQRVVLNLWEATDSWVIPGNMEVRFTDDDATKITKADASPLVLYEPPLDPVNGQFVNDTHDSNGTFLRWIAYNATPGYPEVNNVLFSDGDSNTGPSYLADHIRSSNKLTLAFLDDGSVRGGWVGYGSTHTFQHPQLTVTAVATGHVANCINRPSMDFNGDCKVDFKDFAQFANQWLTCGFEDPNDCK